MQKNYQGDYSDHQLFTRITGFIMQKVRYFGPGTLVKQNQSIILTFRQFYPWIEGNSLWSLADD